MRRPRIFLTQCRRFIAVYQNQPQKSPRRAKGKLFRILSRHLFISPFGAIFVRKTGSAETLYCPRVFIEGGAKILSTHPKLSTSHKLYQIRTNSHSTIIMGRRKLSRRHKFHQSRTTSRCLKMEWGGASIRAAPKVLSRQRRFFAPLAKWMETEPIFAPSQILSERRSIRPPPF